MSRSLPLPATSTQVDWTFTALAGDGSPVDAAGSVTPVANSAVSGSQIAKASAGSLYGFNVTTGAGAGFIMIFDSVTVPADGAVTPKKVYQVAATSTTDRSFNIPLKFATGIVIVFSTTGPFTKTISNTAFIESESV